MSEKSVAVVDTNVLLNLALPVVDSRPRRPPAQTLSKHSLLRMMSTFQKVSSENSPMQQGVMICCLAADLVFQAGTT